ncbi:MAG TPA: hypothetical protein VKR42_08790, partial [Ktedonobacteraceae bacterium]|nr:hypothetical protein [Ktedonobacteraceae bacterium]
LEMRHTWRSTRNKGISGKPKSPGNHLQGCCKVGENGDHKGRHYYDDDGAALRAARTGHSSGDSCGRQGTLQQPWPYNLNQLQQTQFSGMLNT